MLLLLSWKGERAAQCWHRGNTAPVCPPGERGMFQGAPSLEDERPSSLPQAQALSSLASYPSSGLLRLLPCSG